MREWISLDEKLDCLPPSPVDETLTLVRRKQLQAEILVILVVWRPRRATVIVHFLVYFQFGVCVDYV